ncbi:MAG: MFS transporter [Chloroflexi bacterium]|nr:MFS transporter [Chloroflexota bacterium]
MERAHREQSGFCGRRLTLSVLTVLGAILASLVLVLPAFADGEGHGHGGTGVTGFATGPLVWGVVSLGGLFVLLIISRMMLLSRMVRQSAAPGADTGFFQAVLQFSRNAKLFLTYSLLAELGTGIWAVMFNLYLLRIGFPITFIGTFWLVNMMAHGAGALPAGLIADRFGRRRAFFIATFIAVLAQGSLLFVQNPAFILVLAAVAGVGESFHGVTGAPFMMENSEPKERPHLFSLNSSFLQVSRFAGNMGGGMLPLAWAIVLGLPQGEPSAARWALVSGLPLTVMALVPLVFMREKPVELVESFRDLVTLRNVVHFGIIARLALLSIMVGVGFGLTIRFFNIFFQEAHNASDNQIGTMLALGSLASAGSVLISPAVAQRWGKAKGIMVTQVLSIPFLVLMAAVPSLSVVTVLFLVRGAMYSIGLPLRNQLAMEFISPKERGTTAGFTHTAFDLGGGAGAGIAGILIAGGGFMPVFAMAGALILVPGFLYYFFFARMEGRQQAAVMAPAAAGD